MELWILRTTHLTTGVLWVGAAAFIGFYLMPAIREQGPSGAAVMAGVVRRNFPIVINVIGLLNVVSGLRMYMLSYSGEWLKTGTGILLTVGAVCGLGAFVVGTTLQRPLATKLGQLAAAIREAGTPPSAAQQGELETLGRRLAAAARHNGALLVFTALCMAASRYAPF
jgi:uncharacterized membrane protein